MALVGTNGKLYETPSSRNPKAPSSKIKEVQISTGCSWEQAKQAWESAEGNVDLAVEIAADLKRKLSERK